MKSSNNLSPKDTTLNLNNINDLKTSKNNVNNCKSKDNLIVINNGFINKSSQIEDLYKESASLQDNFKSFMNKRKVK